MRILILMTLFGMIGCSSNSKFFKSKSTEKPLDYYVKRFEHFLGRKIKKSTIKIDYIIDSEGNKRIHAAGVCNVPSGKIILNKLRWKGLTDLEKEELVFHELGHCELGLGHPDHQVEYNIPAFIKNDCPKSIMNSGTTGRQMSDSCYKYYYEYYIHELFSIRTRELLK